MNGIIGNGTITASTSTEADASIRGRRHLASFREGIETLRRKFVRRELNLTWASLAEEHRHVNFGDALSPIIVGAISGRRIRKIPFETAEPRLSAIGTIAQNFAGGTVHLWGSGIDRYTPGRNVDEAGYRLPPETRFEIAACRGRHTLELFRSLGVAAPEVFGDPGWFVRKIWPEHSSQEKLYDIGVVPHLSEWNGRRTDALLKPGLRRYEIPEDLAGRVTIINPIAERSFDGVGEVIRKIGQCRRVLSSSLHGIVVAEALGVPAFPFGVTRQHGPQEVEVTASILVDHRMMDLYSILDRKTVPAFCWPRLRPLDWHAVLEWAERQQSVYHFEARPLFDAFPFRRAVAYEAERWPVRDDLLVDGDFL